MTSSISPITGQTPPPEVTPVEVQASITEAATDSARVSIASVADLKTASPKLYNAILMGIASHVRAQQEAANRRIKEILDDAKREQSR